MSIENGSKLFLETCKPYFSNKRIKTSENVILSDKEGHILKEIKVVNFFFFQSIESSLRFFEWPDSSKLLNEPDTIKSVANKCKNQPSIKKIKSNYITINLFSFRQVTLKGVLDVISILDDTKSSGGDIPLWILKDKKILPQGFFNWINDSLKSGALPDPIHKKEDPFDKDNYWPISILPLISKVFEKQPSL